MKNGDTPTGAHAAYEALTSMGEVAQARLQAFLLEALQAQDLKTIAACYDFYISRGDPDTESALIAALNLYADAYGNYDDNGMVAIAERFLNCGNNNLHAAAISWGEGRSFNVEVTPFAKVTQTWGLGVYDSYLGNGMVSWGNKPFKPEDIYVLYRESPQLAPGDSSSKKGTPSIVYAGGSTRYPVTPSSYQEKPCPDLRLSGVDVLTHGEPGVVSVGDNATWVANVLNSSAASQDFEIKVKIDSKTLYKRGGILAPGENVTLSGLLEPGWQQEMALSHMLSIELRFGDSYLGTKSDCLASGNKSIVVTNYRPWPPGLPMPYLPGYIDHMIWNGHYPSTEDMPVPPGLPR
jgi:hypothetical protein